MAGRVEECMQLARLSYTGAEEFMPCSSWPALLLQHACKLRQAGVLTLQPLWLTGQRPRPLQPTQQLHSLAEQLLRTGQQGGQKASRHELPV